MAAVEAAPPLQPTVEDAPPSPTSTTSTTVFPPRPVRLASADLGKTTPTVTPNYSHPIPAPEPVPTAAAPEPVPAPAPVSASASASSTSTSTSTPTKPLPTATAIQLAVPRSILKPGDIHPAHRPPSNNTDSSSSSSSSRNYPSSKHPLTAQDKGVRSTRGKSIREGAFFAFVLLPLSCWYTRGGKRLGTARSGRGSGAGAGAEAGTGKGKGHSLVVERDAAVAYRDEEERRARPLPGSRRSMNGGRESFGQGGASGSGGGGSGSARGHDVVRRQSFSSSVPARVAVGHGRSNSLSSVRGPVPRPGSGPGMGAGAGLGLGLGLGPGAQRREVADYGVDRGAAAVDGEREMARESELERLRLSRAKSRTGSPVPLRRRRSEV